MEKYFFVDDLIPDPIRVKIIFLLESPYKAEVENGYPVAGLSGKEICFLLNQIDPKVPGNIPFGKYLSESADERFGIINCSNNPMDIKTYPPEQHSDEYIKSLDRIRKNPKTSPIKRQNSTDNETHSKLLAVLKLKIERLTSQNNSLLIVTCGNLAKHFFCLTEINYKNTYHIAHPSFNQWRHRKNFEPVQKLKILITSKLSKVGK